MTERWLTYEEAREIVKARLQTSVGRAQAVLADAKASREVRFNNPADPVLLMADDGIVGMNMRPGAQNKGGVTADGKLITHVISRPKPTISEDDLLDWLRRQRGAIKPSAGSKAKGGRPPKFSRAAVAAEVGRLMDHHGEFSQDDPEWNAQARLTEAIIAKFGEAATSTVDEYVKGPLASWRKRHPKT